MAWLLILVPLLAAALAFAVSSPALRAWILPAVGVLHLGILLVALAGWRALPATAWFGLDALGGWVLLVISLLFCICAFYAPAYLALRPDRDHRVLSTCLLGFLGLASLLAQARHPGIAWVAMETTTLVTAPLIYFNQNRRSLEATWKYLVIGSVGIALALLGTLFIAYAAHMGGLEEPLRYTRLVENASLLSRPWLRAGFVLTLVGYGTKMGLAPLHTWKPDAYGETPGLVGALLAGGVTSCAFLALLRIYGVVAAAGEGAFARELLVAFGMLSMAWALVFMIRQTDIKRMLAYSSVEHMGILVFGIGIGGLAAKFALFHLAANALVKSVLFLSAGNIHRSYASKQLPFVTGALRRTPVSGWLFLLAFLAITGMPPFAPFLSEFSIAAGALGTGHVVGGAAFLILLGGIFLAMSETVVKVVFGTPSAQRVRTPYKDAPATTAPLIVALGLALVLGIWLPRPVQAMLDQAGASVDGVPSIGREARR
ncbi:proton-conducting transporter membrane subunit [Geothrix alkalitolerans]|uniref:proton-conducting transporter transmembrane domain-containing protein n=1 Tax=Geothrix alkalitolerans TaxID=2922724 RepID=UPI001FAEBC14|nr:proton-conducting transporter membrane subunit [Geothrix alkalitolerans]